MNIHGLGVDIVNIGRIRRLREKHGSRFLKKCFTALEIGYCLNKPQPDLHFAARFGLKEAVLKALKNAVPSLPLTCIETIADESGVPRAHFRKYRPEVDEILGGFEVECSLSHEREYAVAVALIFERGTLE